MTSIVMESFVALVVEEEAVSALVITPVAPNSRISPLSPVTAEAIAVIPPSLVAFHLATALVTLGISNWLLYGAIRAVAIQ